MHTLTCESFDDTPVLLEQPKPSPGPDQVLVRQHYSSIGAGDLLMARGRPFVFRPVFSALLRPAILGRDVAGVVEAVGPGVVGVDVGDRVVGEAGQAWAEWVVVDTSAMARVPDGVALADAAPLAVSGLTALQGLQRGGIREGAEVLVVGASGGVGHLAVQIAVALGARVTAVCSGAKAEMVSSLGASRVIDYRAERYVDDPSGFDLIFDLAGSYSLSERLGALRDGGVYVSSFGTTGGPWLGPIPSLLRGALRGLWDKRVVVLGTQANTADFETLLGLIERGQLRPHAEPIAGLGDIPDALDRLERGQVRGKVVVDLHSREPRAR